MISDSNWTFGAELEVGDVDRRVPIPPHLGVWAQTETDVINQIGEKRGLACDPMGLEPHWGGEVNMAAQTSAFQAGETMRELLKHLHDQPQNDPTYHALNASHIHIRVPGLRDDLKMLKRLQQYIIDNQEDVLHRSFRDYVPPPYSKTRKVSHPIPLDGKRKMPTWMNENIQQMATTPEEFFVLQRKGKDGKINYRAFRYCVNTYNLSRMDTVEFRWYRPTLNPSVWEEMFHFSQHFLWQALFGSTPAREFISHYDCWAPEITVDTDMMDAWERTRYTHDRGVPRTEHRLQTVSSTS